MSARADALAERLEQGAAALTSFAKSLSDADWRKSVQPDGRPVGVMIHHVASMYPAEVQLAQALATGKSIDDLSWAAVAQMNAKHAHDHGTTSKAEAIELLAKNAGAAAKAIREFTDAQLDRAAPVALYGGAPITTQFFIEDHAMRHSFHHLARIKAALKG